MLCVPHVLVQTENHKKVEVLKIKNITNLEVQLFQYSNLSHH
jgi:hypothetical protein